jgi:N-formylglutamate amidohydrolase
MDQNGELPAAGHDCDVNQGDDVGRSCATRLEPRVSPIEEGALDAAGGRLAG